MDWMKPISKVDPWLATILQREEQRQFSQICLAAASSLCSYAKREAQGSIFSNIDAEGYPLKKMQQQSLDELYDFEEQIAFYKRFGDRRYAKGAEFVNVVEVMAQRRAAAAFATDWASHSDLEVAAADIFVNLQCTTGSLANMAVFSALLEPGDRILSMDLTHGGHLSHGSRLHSSGKTYQVESYGVDPLTERLDYDYIRHLALKLRPGMIVGGASSYPWAIEWKKLWQIAQELSPPAYLLADISHPAGLVVGGLIPNPIGYADVVTFTTYKTLCGPRGAAILWTDRTLSEKINRAVFPGLQSAPIFQQIVAMALAFQEAHTEEFRRLQQSIAENACLLAFHLERLGVPLAFGGTNTHIVIAHLGKLTSNNAGSLQGEWIAQLLERVGIVCNSNLVPGDKNVTQATGLRLGTTWISQLGYQPGDIEDIAKIIAALCLGIQPGAQIGQQKHAPLRTREEALLWSVREQALHILNRIAGKEQAATPDNHIPHPLRYLCMPQVEVWDLSEVTQALIIRGKHARDFLQQLVKHDLSSYEEGKAVCKTLFYTPEQASLPVLIYALSSARHAHSDYLVIYQAEAAPRFADWLRLLSEGIVPLAEEGELKLLESPVVIEGDDCWNRNHDHRMGEIVLVGMQATDILTKLCDMPCDPSVLLSCIQYKQETLYAIYLQTPEHTPVWKLIGTRRCLLNLLSTIDILPTQHFQTVTQDSDVAQHILSYAHTHLGTEF